jgi:hypothetical protein
MVLAEAAREAERRSVAVQDLRYSMGMRGGDHEPIPVGVNHEGAR